ncbi:hypothetical protein [Thiorhodococcus mannitoliphagus]|nr:hypothetical protein [Thiorhodococcus mannitoliphagus]
MLAVEAAEPVLARVLSIDGDRVTLTLDAQAEVAAPRMILLVDAAGLPQGVKAGSLVRVWPGRESGPDGVSLGARLSPLQTDLSGADRTGVRARLMYGAERGFGGGGRGGR